MWNEKLRTSWFWVLLVAVVGFAVGTLVLGWNALVIFIAVAVLVAVTGVVDGVRDARRHDAESSDGTTRSDPSRESTHP
jgi:hypothetical protein